MRIAPSLRLLIPVTAVLLAACESTWVPTSGNYHSNKIGVSADLPDGWARYTPERDVMLTRDGFLLQSMRISREEYGSEIPNTTRKIEKDMLPQEAAQLLIDSMAANTDLHRLEVTDNQPAEVDGNQGFRVEVTYSTADGPTMRETIYGALTPDSYVLAHYRAPDRYYHERTANDFEATVASLDIEPEDAKKKK